MVNLLSVDEFCEEEGLKDFTSSSDIAFALLFPFLFSIVFFKHQSTHLAIERWHTASSTLLYYIVCSYACGHIM